MELDTDIAIEEKKLEEEERKRNSSGERDRSKSQSAIDPSQSPLKVEEN